MDLKILKGVNFTLIILIIITIKIVVDKLWTQ
jgi:hypothetical protein